jgi:hypothetical protein
MAKPHNRRVTAEISPELYASLTAAKLFTGKPLSRLMREGLMHIARKAREERDAMRQAQAESPQAEPIQVDPLQHVD